MALMLLGEAGVLAIETDVLTIETANEPGVLAKIAERPPFLSACWAISLAACWTYGRI
jgi:hypothetical protein